jgi:hypothetical protein
MIKQKKFWEMYIESTYNIENLEDKNEYDGFWFHVQFYSWK